MRRAISEEELVKLKRRTALTIAMIDSVLIVRKDNNLEMRNIRSIKNLINFWKQKLEQVQLVDERLSTINSNLDKTRIKYTSELNEWQHAQEVAMSYNFDDAVIQRITNVTQLLDSNLHLLGRRSDEMLGLLDQTSQTMTVIIDKIDP